MQKSLAILTKLVLSLACAISLNAAEAFDRNEYFGEAVRDSEGRLNHVVENAALSHARDEFVWVTVSNIAINESNKNGRLRVVIWNRAENFADPAKRPFRAVSFPVIEASSSGMMKFKLAGLVKGQAYGFFAHFDENSNGELDRNFFGVPTEPYLFTNTENQGRGPGLKSVGIIPRAPSFDETKVIYTTLGQGISLAF